MSAQPLHISRNALSLPRKNTTAVHKWLHALCTTRYFLLSVDIASLAIICLKLCARDLAQEGLANAPTDRWCVTPGRGCALLTPEQTCRVPGEAGLGSLCFQRQLLTFLLEILGTQPMIHVRV
jgi:hypothetical protein